MWILIHNCVLLLQLLVRLHTYEGMLPLIFEVVMYHFNTYTENILQFVYNLCAAAMSAHISCNFLVRFIMLIATLGNYCGSNKVIEVTNAGPCPCAFAH